MNDRLSDPLNYFKTDIITGKPAPSQLQVQLTSKLGFVINCMDIVTHLIEDVHWFAQERNNWVSGIVVVDDNIKCLYFKAH